MLKYCKAVLVRTKNPINDGNITCVAKDDPRITLFKDLGGIVQSKSPQMHLHIISDMKDKVKGGDWFIFINKHPRSDGKPRLDKCEFLHDNGFIQPNDGGYLAIRMWNPDYCHKVIGSTDTSLGVPTIPPSYIEQYIKQHNSGEGIRDIAIPHNTQVIEYATKHTPCLEGGYLVVNELSPIL